MDTAYAADDRTRDEKDAPDGTPNLEALRNLWYERDVRYAGRKAVLSQPSIDAVRTYRMIELRDLPAAQRAVGADEVSRWTPPVVVR